MTDYDSLTIFRYKYKPHSYCNAVIPTKVIHLSPVLLLYLCSDLLMEVVGTRLISTLELILEGRQNTVERMSDEKELLVSRQRLIDHSLLRGHVGDGGVHGVPAGKPNVTKINVSHITLCIFYVSLSIGKPISICLTIYLQTMYVLFVNKKLNAIMNREINSNVLMQQGHFFGLEKKRKTLIYKYYCSCFHSLPMYM